MDEVPNIPFGRHSDWQADHPERRQIGGYVRGAAPVVASLLILR